MSMVAARVFSRWLCPAALLALSLACWAAPVALAAWSAQGAGGGGAAAQVMPAGATPAVTVTGNSAGVSWPAVTLSGGAPVGGYLIQRYDAGGAAQQVGPGCAGVVTATRCTEQNVPAGTWTYTDTPVLANWTGQESPASGPAGVGQSTGAPGSTPGGASKPSRGIGSTRGGVGRPSGGTGNTGGGPGQPESGSWPAPGPIDPPLHPGPSLP